MRALSAKALAVKSNGLSSLLGPVRLQTSQTWPPGSPGILQSLPVTGSSRMSESHLYPKLLPPRDRAALSLDVLPCTIQPFWFNPFSSGSPAVAAGFPFVSSASPSSHALGWWSRWTPWMSQPLAMLPLTPTSKLLLHLNAVTAFQFLFLNSGPMW